MTLETLPRRCSGPPVGPVRVAARMRHLPRFIEASSPLYPQLRPD